jgi:UDP-N-acetylglucosamine--N-acetylmuramyl-(pentapeptide) pyrophosphoryl-undecaprenol N-acetylglucosamine transferase
MGKVNRWIAPFAMRVGLQFPIAGCNDAKFVPSVILKKETLYTRTEARHAYGIDPEAFTILVFGGSQGAAFFNDIMPQVAKQLPAQVIHCAGNGPAAENVKRTYLNQAVVKAFETNMSLAYSAADFVVGRSGAGTMAELLQHAKPSLLIPYPYAVENHQHKNAEYLRELGGAIVLDQDKANVQSIVTAIQSANLEAMQLALRTASQQNRVLNDLTQLVLQDED